MKHEEEKDYLPPEITPLGMQIMQVKTQCGGGSWPGGGPGGNDCIAGDCPIDACSVGHQVGCCANGDNPSHFCSGGSGLELEAGDYEFGPVAHGTCLQGGTIF